MQLKSSMCKASILPAVHSIQPQISGLLKPFHCDYSLAEQFSHDTEFIGIKYRHANETFCDNKLYKIF